MYTGTHFSQAHSHIFSEFLTSSPSLSICTALMCCRVINHIICAASSLSSLCQKRDSVRFDPTALGSVTILTTARIHNTRVWVKRTSPTSIVQGEFFKNSVPKIKIFASLFLDGKSCELW